MDFSSPHVFIILVILGLILLGMFAGMTWNLKRKLASDKEELAASREKSLAASSRISVSPGDPEVPSNVPAPARSKKTNGDCYVPDSGNSGFPMNNPRF